MARQNVPGTVWKSHGAWHWKVKFPDETKRRDVVLTFRDRLVGRGLARVEPMRPGEDERRRARHIADGILPRVVGDRWDTHAYARAIARAVFSFTSRWRGTASMRPVITLRYQSWSWP